MVQTIDWHQDAHYYNKGEEHQWNIVSCWMPIVPVDDNKGCLQVLPKYHLGGLRPRETLPRNDLIGLANSELEGFDPVSCVMKPGDVLLFGPLIAHRSIDNRGPGIRWSIDIRFARLSESIIEHSKRGYVSIQKTIPVESRAIGTSRSTRLFRILVAWSTSGYDAPELLN